MKILPVIYFVTFGAMIVIFGSLIGTAFWLLTKAWQIWQIVTRPD
jgi:hypothetical protein